MRTNFKKLIAVLVISLFVSGVGQAPVAKATTLAELQAQLNALIAQLAQMQAAQSGNQNSQGNSGNSYRGNSSNGCSFSRTIRIGSIGSDVTCLQGVLIESGYLKASATGYFGALSSAAVRQWQVEHELASTGVWGSAERTAYAATFDNDTNDDNDNNGSGSNSNSGSGQMCAQVMRQCWNGTYVGYRPGTCTYYDCPAYVPPTTTPAPPSSWSESGTLRIALDSTSVPSSVVPGSVGNQVLRIVATPISGSARLTDLTVTDTISGGSNNLSSFQNFTLWGGVGDSQVAGPIAMTMNGVSNGTISFNLAGSGLLLLAGNNYTLTIKADVATTSSGAVAVGSSHVFSVANSGPIAFATNGVTNGGRDIIIGSVVGSSIYISSGTSQNVAPSASINAASGFANPTVVAGTNNQRVASFVITASTAQAIQVGSLTFSKTGSGIALQNLKVMIGGTQFGNTIATVGANVSAASFSSYAPISVNAGGSQTVDVYADVLSSATAGTYYSVISLVNWQAGGTISGSALAFPGTVSGQNVTVTAQTASAPGHLTLTLDSSTPPAKSVVMGSTNNEVARFRFYADNNDDLRITDLVIKDTISGGATGLASFESMTLWDGNTQVAGPITPTSNSASLATISFSLSGSGVIVSRNTAKTLTLKGTVSTFTSGGAVSNSQHVFSINANSDITVRGVNYSATPVTVTGAPVSGYSMKVLRTSQGVTASVIGSSSSRVRTAVDDVATLNITADSAYQVALQVVKLYMTGGALANVSGVTVDLIDSNTNTPIGSATAQTCNAVNAGCTLTFSPNFTISAGTTKQMKIRINSSSFTNSGGADGLQILLNTTDAIQIGDGTANNIPALDSTAVPFMVAQISYE